MNAEIHTIAAKEHFETAEKYDEKIGEEKDENRKTALRTVASQNYFYAGINAIEPMLAKISTHSFNHENRNRNMAEHPEISKNPTTTSQ